MHWKNESVTRTCLQSTAILARRKMGKTALMERLFNITFFKNDGVIPFYYEIKENDIWLVDFCKDFFLTFVRMMPGITRTRTTVYMVSNIFLNPIIFKRPIKKIFTFDTA